MADGLKSFLKEWVGYDTVKGLASKGKKKVSKVRVKPKKQPQGVKRMKDQKRMIKELEKTQPK